VPCAPPPDSLVDDDRSLNAEEIAVSHLYRQRIGRLRSEPPARQLVDEAVRLLNYPQLASLIDHWAKLGEESQVGFAHRFVDRWLALIAAAVLPGLGHHALLRRRKREDERHGYEVVLDNEAVVGRLDSSAKRLVDSMNTAILLLSSPESLARLLEAAGSITLQRCGAILDEEFSHEGELVQ